MLYPTYPVSIFLDGLIDDARKRLSAQDDDPSRIGPEHRKMLAESIVSVKSLSFFLAPMEKLGSALFQLPTQSCKHEARAALRVKHAASQLSSSPNNPSPSFFFPLACLPYYLRLATYVTMIACNITPAHQVQHTAMCRIKTSSTNSPRFVICTADTNTIT